MITRPRVVLMALATTHVGFFLGSSAKPIDNKWHPNYTGVVKRQVVNVELVS